MNTITITIGRNVPTAGLPIEMDDRSWAGFKNDVQTVLDNHYATVYVKAAAGRGEWEGIEEENATYVAALDPAFLAHLRQALAGLAYDYGQDAIALTVGTTDLVGQAVV